MKIELNVSCKYTVNIEIDDVPDDIVAQLEAASGVIDSDSELADWLSDNVYERDALEWEFEVNNIIKNPQP